MVLKFNIWHALAVVISFVVCQYAIHVQCSLLQSYHDRIIHADVRADTSRPQMNGSPGRLGDDNLRPCRDPTTTKKEDARVDPRVRTYVRIRVVGDVRYFSCARALAAT